MISQKVRDVELSGIRKMFEMADEDTINLGLGQPDFQPPEGAIDAYYKAMREGHNGYGSTYGLDELRKEIANDYSRYKSGLDKENVLMHVGATQAFKVTTESIIQNGDEVLYPEPGFVLYDSQIKLAGGKPISYPVEQKHGFVPQIDELEKRVTSNTKAIIVNSPSNPTGGVFPEDEVKKIIDWAKENDLLIISDEVYEKMIYEGEHVSFLGDYENVIMINSFSKVFAMTGWRVGYTITQKDWVEELGKVNYYNIACPPIATQHAVLHALRNEMDFVNNMTNTFQERRDIIVNRLNDIPGFDCLKPKGAFYVFPSFDLDLTAKELAMELLDNGMIATHGTAFGPTGEGHLRFSYANSTENIKKAMDIVEETVADLEG
ncbi:MAG: pyridoxal phosphate-dependent aminotransferase [Candidatus Thermoplasmatota archaeon]